MNLCEIGLFLIVLGVSKADLLLYFRYVGPCFANPVCMPKKKSDMAYSISLLLNTSFMNRIFVRLVIYGTVLL